MARNVFFSFHYQRDISRVNIVRNHMMTKGGYQSAGYWDRSLWESIKRTGDLAIKRMINQGLENTSVTVVLIGTETANRSWVQYEILKSLERGNGLIGVRIHNVRNFQQQTDQPGNNPFDYLHTTNAAGFRTSVSQLYPTYNWVTDDGYNNFQDWVEKAARLAGK
jgi:hypothetical protein